jgi:UPF0755 protein
VNRKTILRALYISVPLASALITYIGLQRFFSLPLDPSATTTTLFEVRPEENLRQIARNLEEASLLRSHFTITTLAKLQKKDTLVMAGEYELSPSMSPQQILDSMVEGRMILRKVTIKEGSTIREIGPILEQAGIATTSDFNAALQDTTILETLKVPASSFEGYLFPETYRFQKNTPPRKVLEKMKSQFDKNWLPLWDSRLIELEMTKHQVLTLASIIEKESGNVEEQPLVSSVFHNRLEKGMRLQADPTVIYGIPNFDGNITKEHLTTATPYNTYVIQGLPPGPISNPGTSAIKAALFPRSSAFLFFVGNGKGKHIFSETLEQHNEAVNTFQRGIGVQEEAPQDSPTAPPESVQNESPPSTIP